MGSRSSPPGRVCPFLVCPFLVCAVLFLSLGFVAAAQERQRAFEVYSDARFDEESGDFQGIELEIFLWDGSAEATVTAHGRVDPVKLRGVARGAEVSVSVADGDLILELTGTRRKKRFDGTLLLRRRDEVVWKESLRLPRRRYGKT